ncbi:MAG: hypothetical protein QXL96_00710 [Ignisphaera sp.]
MNTLPWEAHNISSINASSRINIIELLMSPIDYIPSLKLILIIVSIALIVFGAMQIKNLYEDYRKELKK